MFRFYSGGPPPKHSNCMFRQMMGKERQITRRITDDWQRVNLMPAPAIIPGIPNGLEYLAAIDHIIVDQLIEMIELISNIEGANGYSLKNVYRQQAYFAFEESNPMMRQMMGKERQFTMIITDNWQGVVIRVHDPFKQFEMPIGSGFIECPLGVQIGRVVLQSFIAHFNLTVEDSFGHPMFVIRGPVCTMENYRDQIFTIICAQTMQQVGAITKKFGGMAKEMYTDADTFVVNFPMAMDVYMKACILGANFDDSSRLDLVGECAARPFIRRLINRYLLTPTDNDLICRQYICPYEIALPISVFVIIFKALQRNYGANYTGFYDFSQNLTGKLTREDILNCRTQIVPGKVGLHFLHRPVRETETMRMFHTALCRYNPATHTADIYEPCAVERKEDVCDDYMKRVVLYCVHLLGPKDNLRIGYVQNFAVQPDSWSCSLFAVFAAVITLADADPVKYRINLRGSFKVAKLCAEKGGRMLKDYSIHDLLALVGTTKEVHCIEERF